MKPDLDSYSNILVMFSGGKDSLACVLHLLERGVPREKIELWHHLVDGREGSELMDWPCTEGYCRAIAKHLGLPIYFSWKEGGFEREMLREATPTAPIHFETPSWRGVAGGNSSSVGTRKQFPQVSADLSVRWCSAYLKIDVASTAIRNQDRFRDARTLVVTGERAQESPSRAMYRRFEAHRSDRRRGKRIRRHVDHWRPIHRWRERKVWQIIERWSLLPHPAYRLGWGRVSCAACIFGNAQQWASLKAVNPSQFERIAQYEESFGKTIRKDLTVRKLAVVGVPYKPALDPELVAIALGREYVEDVVVTKWTMPPGAFGEACGPT